ncbi:MAG: hypothetical protein ACJ77X_01660 [Chloroflexota bacterium]
MSDRDASAGRSIAVIEGDSPESRFAGRCLLHPGMTRDLIRFAPVGSPPTIAALEAA